MLHVEQPSRTLLVVDDQELLAEYMVCVAEDAGWKAEQVTSPEEFEARLDQVQPDLVALDLALPGRDGIELMRFLALQNYTGRLMIVSGCDHDVVEASAALAREHGLDVIGYAQKPITEEDFVSLLDQAAGHA